MTPGKTGRRDVRWPLAALVLSLLLAGLLPPLAAQGNPTPGQQLFALRRDAPAGSPDVDWLEDMADALAALGDEDAALAYRAAAAQQTGGTAAWRALADAFMQRGNWPAARDALEALLAARPGDPQAHYDLGVLYAPHDPAAAYDHLAQAVVDPVLAVEAGPLLDALAESDASPAYQAARLGIALSEQQHWPQAESAFANAVAQDPTYGDAWAYLGLARAMQGRSGLLAANNALVLAPQNPLTLYLAGLAYRAAGQDAQSLNLLASAQALDPQNPAFAAELGAAYRRQGDLASAEQWLTTAAQAAPEDSGFARLLALFYAEERFNLEGNGLTAIQAALAQRPDDAELQAAYAWALYSLYQPQEAEEAIQTALALAPENPRVLYYFAMIQEQLGRREDAVNTYLNLLTHPDPQGYDELARRALERLGYGG